MPTMAPDTIPTTEWCITYASTTGLARQQTVLAAYFTEVGSLTILKDDHNAAVFAVPTNVLISIERAPVADPIMTAFKQALQQATKDTGPQIVGFRNGTTDDTGRTTETGYDITVQRFDSANTTA